MGGRPYVLVTAGHRSTGDGGDPTEQQLTQYLAKDDVAALRDAGYTADWWQRDLDGDGSPTMTEGSLDTVALGCGRVLRGRAEPMSVLLDCHYNGPHSAVHVIVPDTVGLHTAYAGGAPGDDTAANNTLDVQLAKVIAGEIVKATGGALYQGLLGVAGVMSERECGVALQYSARLAMFAATADSRQKAIRLVIEHGGYQDPAAVDDGFSGKCAGAVVRALDAVFDPAKPIEAPKPKPPAGELWPYPNPVKPAWWDDLMSGDRTFVSDGGTVWYRTSNRYRVLKSTRRAQLAVSGSHAVGPDLAPGTVFDAAVIGQSAADRTVWVITPMLSRVDLAALAFVPPLVEQQQAKG